MGGFVAATGLLVGMVELAGSLGVVEEPPVALVGDRRPVDEEGGEVDDAARAVGVADLERRGGRLRPGDEGAGRDEDDVVVVPAPAAGGHPGGQVGEVLVLQPPQDLGVVAAEDGQERPFGEGRSAADRLAGDAGPGEVAGPAGDVDQVGDHRPQPEPAGELDGGEGHPVDLVVDRGRDGGAGNGAVAMLVGQEADGGGPDRPLGMVGRDVGQEFGAARAGGLRGEPGRDPLDRVPVGVVALLVDLRQAALDGEGAWHGSPPAITGASAVPSTATVGPDAARDIGGVPRPRWGYGAARPRANPERGSRAGFDERMGLARWSGSGLTLWRARSRCATIAVWPRQAERNTTAEAAS